MSGGHFDYERVPECFDGAWLDSEVNDLVHDLFFGGEFSVRGHGGLLQSLDFFLACDICEESYREKVAAFKKKWFKRTPKNRCEYYQRKLQERCDELKKELAGI